MQYSMSDIPKSLREYVNYVFVYGEVTPKEYKSFARKYRNVLKKMLPNGWEIVEFGGNWFTMSGVIKTDDDRFIFVSIPDVRYSVNAWIDDILIRTMKNDHDWTGGMNHYTSLFEFSEDVQKLYR
ncbi:MAG: hypothetical protein J5725_03550 [Bacteroidales bacterium]|nr:hypothetical protein [Bacteroidales bacterium]